MYLLKSSEYGLILAYLNWITDYLDMNDHKSYKALAIQLIENNNFQISRHPLAKVKFQNLFPDTKSVLPSYIRSLKDEVGLIKWICTKLHFRTGEG